MPGAVLFRCHGCGAEVDLARGLPYRCPAAGEGDVDHLLAAVDPLAGQALPLQAPAPPRAGPLPAGPLPPLAGEQDPFLRYRAALAPYRLARAAGLSEPAWAGLVGELEEALGRVDGRGFRVTPLLACPELAAAAGIAGDLLVKDETGNVAGSHKARHLMGVLLHLRVLEAARLPAGEGLAGRRLAIASCGNAALAAAVLARAAGRPLDVFIPPDAEEPVVARLRDLGATISVCHRAAGEAGDPCFRRFREAVAGGAIPFGVQGPENGLAVEGAWTLALELAEQAASAGAAPAELHVQVGGGALASAVAQGMALAQAAGLLPRLPRLLAVQTEGCAPLARALQRLGPGSLAEAARARSRYMWPWETTPRSLAHGILDDETYDWWAIAAGVRESGGDAVVVGEAQVARAVELARRHTALRPSATGTAGLAGCLARPPRSGPTAVLFSGGER